MPQDNGFLKYNRCNIYRTQVDGYVSETGDGEALFWDRGCVGLLSVSGMFVYVLPLLVFFILPSIKRFFSWVCFVGVEMLGGVTC